MPIKQNFSWIALTVGLVFSVLLMWSSPLSQNTSAQMPLLMALFMAELGLLVTLAGAIVALNIIRKDGISNRFVMLATGNLILAINLVYVGYSLWPNQGFAG